jgi:hypothetical protein
VQVSCKHLRPLRVRYGVLPSTHWAARPASHMTIRATLMTITALVFRFVPSFARHMPGIAALIAAEYNRATLAAWHYESLKRRDVAGPRRRRIGVGGIPRAVFEALYTNKDVASRSRLIAREFEE